MTDEELQNETILYRFTTDESDYISDMDRYCVCVEYVVVACKEGNSGLVVYGKNIWGEWVANPGERPVVRRLLHAFAAVREECAAIAAQRAEGRRKQAETCWPDSKEIVLVKAGEAEAVASDIRRVGRYDKP